MRLLENILSARQWFLSGIHVSRLVECQLKTMNIQGDQAPAKRQESWKIRELIHEDHRQTIRKLTDTAGVSYGVCQEILT
jgi:hypothetical protein